MLELHPSDEQNGLNGVLASVEASKEPPSTHQKSPPLAGWACLARQEGLGQPAADPSPLRFDSESSPPPSTHQKSPPLAGWACLARQEGFEPPAA